MGLGVALGVVLFDNLFSSPCLWRRPKKRSKEGHLEGHFSVNILYDIFCTISVRFLYDVWSISECFLHEIVQKTFRNRPDIVQKTYRNRTEDIVQNIDRKVTFQVTF